MKTKRLAGLALCALALSQMAAEALGSKPLRAAAAASGAAPAPKVFCDVRGFETFSNRFLVERFTDAGVERGVIDRASYAKLRGPYNRRNVYGAAVAYGPVLPRELRDPVLRRALCGGDLAGGRPARFVRLSYVPLDGDGRAAAVVEVPCR